MSEKSVDDLLTIVAVKPLETLKRRASVPDRENFLDLNRIEQVKRGSVWDEFKAAAKKPQSKTQSGMVKDGVPAEEDLEGLSLKLGTSWELVARRLNFNNEEITALHRDIEELTEKAFTMLFRWKMKYGSEATYRVLYHALCHDFINRKDLAEEFCCGADSVMSAEDVLRNADSNLKLKPDADRETLLDLNRMEQVKEGVKKGKEISVDIAKKASSKGFKVSDNAGSGNCLFHALSEQLEIVKGIRVPYEELRKTLVQFLMEHPNLRDGTELFNFVSGHPSWADYLTSMGKDGTWGDHVILYAAANCYETKIRVISLLSDHPDVIINPSYHVGSTKPLVLGHIQEVHYVSLQDPKAPSEILKRGPEAVKAYNKAIEQGVTRVMRVPIMIIGQERSGKTSLKKSLTGQQFDKEEKRTDSIKRDPSYFSVSTEIWSTGKTKQESDSNSALSLDTRVARVMADDLVDLFTPTASEGNVVSSNSITKDDSETEQDLNVPEKPVSSIGGRKEERNEEGREEKRKEERKEKTFYQEVPDKTAECLKKIINDSTRKDENKVYSILWDFGGQSVYYVTHPIFLTGKAIYLLVYDLSKDPNETAIPVVMQGVFEKKKDSYCTKTNEDYLHLWLSSVSSLPSQHKSPSESFGSGKLPKKMPPVIFVCTHADRCDPAKEDSAKELARGIYGSLKKKPYGKHLSKKFFVVDNTKSGSGEECPDVKRLRDEVLEVAKQLPQMRQFIPIKWLHFEEALIKYKIEKFISFDKAKRVARDECGIDDDQQFDTLLNFLHDQRILIHFDDTPELKDMVILDPQWLIDLFKAVITVKVHDDEAEEEDRCKELWEKLETEGILDGNLLQIVWGPSLNTKTKESLIAIMEKFSLLCHLPSVDKQKQQYLVPSMLMSCPDKAAKNLLADEFIPPLFIRFSQTRPLDYPCEATGVSSISEHLQVPLGLFPRLVVKFLQGCVEARFKQLYKNMYQNFARFPILPEGFSAILLCHSSSIEIAVHRDPKTTSDNSDVTVGYNVRRQIESMLQDLRKECFWLNTMEYEFSVICPVCCNQRSVRNCDKHRTSGCEKEECLHFWSETELHDEQFCRMSSFAEGTEVPVEKLTFVHWFRFLEMKEQAVDDFLCSYGDSLVKDLIATNIDVMDELARGLDPTCNEKYWKHLAKEFQVPDEVEIKCQHNPENSPSANMLQFQEGCDPDFPVQKLKDGLSVISRNDLVKKVEQCSLPDTATLQDLRREHPETFESICLQLDHHKNWKRLGQNFEIPDVKLQQFRTISSCTETVLETIEKKNPNLTVKEMRNVLSVEMSRNDVCKVLEIYFEPTDEKITITTLRDNLDCLEKVATLLDQETPGVKNWLYFASEFGDFSTNELDNLKPRRNPSPTKALLEHIVQKDPNLKVRTFIQTLIKMKRLDVVKALKDHFCEKDQKVSDSLIAQCTVQKQDEERNRRSVHDTEGD